MAWFKIDDGFHGHPKIVGVSTSAVGLWTLAGTWASQYLTDGVVPLAMVWRLGGSQDDADALVAAGLWIVSSDGYTFHDWWDYQPDAASTKAKREAESEGGLRGNHTRWHVGRGVVVKSCEFCKESGTRSANDQVGDRVPDQAPDRVGDWVPDGGPESPPNPPGLGPGPSFSNEKELSSEVAVTTPRPDVERLLDLLESEVVANGGRAPSRNGKNRDAMRLLLDKDGRSVEQVETAIRWCQADEFWRSNILSASKLREKYDQLRLTAQRRSAGASRAVERQNANLEVVSRLAAMDAADEGGLLAVGE